jgi:hypothetical protein
MCHPSELTFFDQLPLPNYTIGRMCQQKSLPDHHNYNKHFTATGIPVEPVSPRYLIAISIVSDSQILTHPNLRTYLDGIIRIPSTSVSVILLSSSLSQFVQRRMENRRNIKGRWFNLKFIFMSNNY